MNKKIVTLILVVLISFCFLSIVVADNGIHDNHETTAHKKTIDKSKTIDKNKTTNKNKTTDKTKSTDKDKTSDKNKSTDKINTTDKNKTIDTNNATDKNKTDNKTKSGYVLANGKGNNIRFSDGSRGFILDYSKPSASPGDEFKPVSASHASNSNTLKLAIIECYRQDSTGQIGGIMADFVQTGSSNTRVGEAVAASHEKVGNHAVVKINNHTEAIFEFEVLKSVSGNESDYFAYKVSFRTIDDNEKVINQTNNLTNLTNTTNTTNTTNVTNTTNITNITQQLDNDTNATFLKDLYDYLVFLANSLYSAWEPIIDTLINDVLMIVNALEELANLVEDFMAEIQSLMDGLEELLKMLESIWNGLAGLLKLLGVLLTFIEQLLNLLGSILNFIVGLISAIISLIQQLLGLLFGLINQIIALIQSIISLLTSVGSFLVNVIKNAAIIISTFVIIAIGAFVYNRIR